MTVFKKRITFILPTRNRAGVLDRALKNAKKLKNKNDELIVIDGGSQDNTLQIIKKYSKLINIFISEPDISSSHAANKAILLSQGEYIKLLADDDIIYPGALKRAINILKKNPEIEVLVCGGIFEDVKNKTKVVLYAPVGSNYGDSIEDVFNYGGSSTGMIIRKSTIAKAGLFPLTWIADTSFLVLCIANNCIVKFCRIKLFYAELHENNIRSVRSKEINSETFSLLKVYASKSFYWRSRLNILLYHYPMLNFMFFLPLLVFKTIRTFFYHPKRPKPPNLPMDKYIWDGGFS